MERDCKVVNESTKKLREGIFLVVLAFGEGGTTIPNGGHYDAHHRT